MGKIYIEIMNLKRMAKALFTVLAVAFLATNAFAGVGDGDLNDLKNNNYTIVYYDATGNYDRMSDEGSLSGTFPAEVTFSMTSVTLNATNSPISGERKFMGWYTSMEYTEIAVLNNTNFDAKLDVDNKGYERTVTVYAGWDNGEGVAVGGDLNPNFAVKVSYYDDSNNFIYLSYYDARYRYNLPKYPQRSKVFDGWTQILDETAGATNATFTLKEDANGRQYIEGKSSDGLDIKLKGAWSLIAEEGSGSVPCTFYSIMYLDASGNRLTFDAGTNEPYFYQLGSAVSLPSPPTGSTKWVKEGTTTVVSEIDRTTMGDLILKAAN